MEKTIEVVKFIPQERVQNRTVEQIIDMPVVVQRQVQETVEVPQIPFIDEAVDVPVVVQRQLPVVQKVQKTVEVPQAQSTDKVMNAPVILQRHVPTFQVVQKTVEVPQIQFIDRMVDIPAVQQRQEPMEQTATKVNVLVNASHIAVETASQPFPTISAFAESSVMHQSVPQPVSAKQATRPVVELASHAAASAPSKREVTQPSVAVTRVSKNHCVSMRNTLIDERHDEFEAEHGEGSTRHVVDPSCRKRKGSDITQSPRVRALARTHDADDRREIFFGDSVSTDGELDDTKSKTECSRKELNEMKKMLQFLVRRERRVDLKTEVAAKKLQRLEREREEEDDKERESSLKEALADKTKVVKLVVDKWFADKGFGFGKVPTGETIFIHASTVHGGKVLTIGTDAWVQVVNDEARAEGGIEHGTPGDKVPGRRRKTGKRRTGWLSK